MAIKASDLLALSGGTSGTQWYRWRVYVKDANGFTKLKQRRVFKFVDKSAVNYALKIVDGTGVTVFESTPSASRWDSRLGEQQSRQGCKSLMTQRF